MKFSVTDLIVNAECELVETLDDDQIARLHIWVLNIIRGYIDAVSFVNGVGLTLILTEFTGTDRVTKQLVNRFTDLASLCSFSSDELFLLNGKDRPVLKHIHDLADSLVNPMEAFSLCARAVEGLRTLMAPNEPREKQWKYMREQLNLTEGYLKYITDKSKDTRHGGTHPIVLAEIHEVRIRSWTIANRFLEHRKRNKKQLPEKEFPVL